ncbi:hypothetical protein CDIK_3188 [Cucumispora dikerogammari]|nr:hypothetical protein CDIK_3188 [Cucumispora dikerogammari]
MVHSYFNERRSRKRTIKFFTYVINLCVHNSYILYNKFYEKADILNSQLKFRQALVRFLAIENTKISQDDIKRETDNLILSPALSLDDNHDIRRTTKQIEVHHHRSYQKRKYRRCRECLKKSVKAQYFIVLCAISLIALHHASNCTT